MSQENNIKNIIIQEYAKCAKDPIHFFKKYCYISHPIKGRILFNLYPFQEKTFSVFTNERFTIINKSRQLGLSTLVAGYALWLMLFHKDKMVLCIATKQATAAGMVEKVQFMYENLPTWLRGKDKPLKSSALSLKLRNNSQIVATSAASDAGRHYSISLLILDEAAFINDIKKIYTSAKPTLATGGQMIALSSPNGIGNWFHQMYTEAQTGDNEFFPLELKWNLHPDRDEKWEATERANMSPREFAQEYDCDFLGSGNNVVDSEILNFYEENYVQEPIEKRFLGGDFWIWQYPDYNKKYIISVDVARGDGSDFSAYHVIDVDNCEQVAEYKSKISTRELGYMLCSVGTEYNNALLIIENSNIGWDVVQTVIERNYQNLYYSPRSYGDLTMDKYLDKLDSEQVIPGFTLSTKTRPLVIAKLEAHLRERTFIFHSKRFLSELRTFIWTNSKAQAQSGYNDDLCISAGEGLFIRDTASKFLVQANDLNKAAIDNIQKSHFEDKYPMNINGRFYIDPYNVTINGQNENLRWLL